jgi:hypothetical protein
MEQYVISILHQSHLSSHANEAKDMHANRYKYFRWTPRTAGISFAFMVAFPALVGYVAYTTDVSHDETTVVGLLTYGP